MPSKPTACAVITDNDMAAIKKASPLVDIFEVRIDLIGQDWREVVPALEKPWIATNRMAAEGGKWSGSEARRKAELVDACELGASMADIELASDNLESIVAMIKKRAKCLVSYHNFEITPGLDELKNIVEKMLAAGADACKVVATAGTFEDNITMLKLLRAYPQIRLTAFAMGDIGLPSRALGPLIGGMVYTSLHKGNGSAPGQFTASEWRELYRLVRGDHS